MQKKEKAANSLPSHGDCSSGRSPVAAEVGERKAAESHRQQWQKVCSSIEKRQKVTGSSGGKSAAVAMGEKCYGTRVRTWRGEMRREEE